MNGETSNIIVMEGQDNLASKVSNLQFLYN